MTQSIYILKSSGTLIRKFGSFSPDPHRSYHFPIFFHIYHFLLWQQSFYFKSNWWFSRWPPSNSHSSRRQFCSSHFFAISEFKGCTILIILSPVSTFMLSKILVRVKRKFFRPSLKFLFLFGALCCQLYWQSHQKHCPFLLPFLQCFLQSKVWSVPLLLFQKGWWEFFHFIFQHIKQSLFIDGRQFLIKLVLLSKFRVN